MDWKYNPLSPDDDTSAIPIETLTFHAGKWIFVEGDIKPQISAFTDFLALCHRLTDLCIKISPNRTSYSYERGKFSNLVPRLQPLAPVLERLEINVDAWGKQYVDWLYRTATTPMCSIEHFSCLKELNIPQEAFTNYRPGLARVQSLQGTLPQSLEKLTVKFVNIEFLPLLEELCSQHYSLRNLAEVTLQIQDDWVDLTSGAVHSNAPAMKGSIQRVRLNDLQPWFTVKITEMEKQYGNSSGIRSILARIRSD